MEYCITLLIIAFGILQFDRRHVRNYRSRRLYNFICLILILLSFLAYHIGTDAFAYLYEFDEYSKIGDIDSKYLFSFERYQPGWVLFQVVSKSIVPSYYFMKLLYALFINIIICNFIWENTKYPFIGLLLYGIILYPFFNFEIYRQAMAVAIFLYSLRYYNEGKWVKYCICIGCAFLFHSSALILLIAPFFNFKLDKRNLIISISLAAGLIIVGEVALDFIQAFFSLGVVSSESGSELLEYYMTSDRYGDSGFSVNSIIYYCFYVLFPITCIYYMNRKGHEIKYQGLVVLSCLIYLMGQIIPIFFRLNQYLQVINILFYIDAIMVLPQIIFRKNSKLVSLAFCFFFMWFFSGTYFQEIGNSGYKSGVRYYPYYSILTKKTSPEREEILRTISY